jgi:teichuronic acid biosynthesis glycosyltransferase TuaH
LNPLFGVFGERYRVFYCKDDYVAGAKLMRIKESRLRRAEARQPRMANIIVAVSQVLVERFERMGYNAHLIPNGCDADAFRVTADPPGRVIDIPHPVAAMVGQLSDRVDLAYLEAVADRGLSLLLIGPRHPVGDEARLGALLARSNVYWVGPKSFAQLPSYLRVADVCLLPYADSAFNQASFPLKVLEYLAAGQGVVATDLPAVRWLETDLVTVASTPTSFADSACALATHAPDTGLRARRAEFAAQHSWTARGVALAGLLGLHEATSSGGVPRHTTIACEDQEQR